MIDTKALCTGSKSVFLAESAAETRSVQRKGVKMQWKATAGAVESWSSQVES